MTSSDSSKSDNANTSDGSSTSRLRVAWAAAQRLRSSWMVASLSTPDHDTVKILAFVDQTTTSTRLTRPQIDQNRVMLTMSQANGRWLVSKVEAL